MGWRPGKPRTCQDGGLDGGAGPDSIAIRFELLRRVPCSDRLVPPLPFGIRQQCLEHGTMSLSTGPGV